MIVNGNCQVLALGHEFQSNGVPLGEVFPGLTPPACGILRNVHAVDSSIFQVTSG